MSITFTAAPGDGAPKMVPTKAMMKGMPCTLEEEFAGTSGATNMEENKGMQNPRQTVQSCKKAPSCTVTRQTEQQGSVLFGDEGSVQNLTLNLSIIMDQSRGKV